MPAELRPLGTDYRFREDVRRLTTCDASRQRVEYGLTHSGNQVILTEGTLVALNS